MGCNGDWDLLAGGGRDLLHVGSKRRLEKKNENGEWGNWCTGEGSRGERWNGAARVNAHFILEANGEVCWGNYHDESIKTASATERGGKGTEKTQKKYLPIDVQEILRK